MPEVPQVKTCCFCFSTEVGCKIIGWLYLVLGILQFLSWIFVLIGSLGKNQPKGSTTNSLVEIIFAVLEILMGVYLLLGVYRRNMRLVKTWLTVATIYLVIIGIGIIWLLINGHFDVLSQLINVLLTLYFLIVVYSYYRENLNTAPATY